MIKVIVSPAEGVKAISEATAYKVMCDFGDADGRSIAADTSSVVRGANRAKVTGAG